MKVIAPLLPDYPIPGNGYVPTTWIRTERIEDLAFYEILMWLDGFKDRFEFAFTVTDQEIVEGSSVNTILANRAKRARKILIADWERAGRPRS